MEQMPFIVHRYSGGTTVENRSPQAEWDRKLEDFIDEESLVLEKQQRFHTSSKVGLKFKLLSLRFAPRRAVLFILFMFLIVQTTILMLSDLSWVTVQPPVAPSKDYDADFNTQTSDQLSSILLPIKSHLEFLKDNALYLEVWAAKGEVLPGLDFGQYDKIDGLWSWLNGSDPRHRAVLEYYESDPATPALFPDADNDSRFRENDELRYSLRSAKAALGDYLRTSHVIAADYWPSGLPQDLPSGNNSDSLTVVAVEDQQIGRSDVFRIEKGLIRYGSIPQWLDLQHPSIRTGDEGRTFDYEAPALRIQHDWSVYCQLQNNFHQAEGRPTPPGPPDILEWKLSVLPTFNSGAKEAAMGAKVTDLSDAFFYSNDDYYLGRSLTTADFSSPLYGPAFLIARKAKIDPVEHPEDGLGEFPSYKYTTWVLGERFGRRPRSYIHHVHKTYIRPLVLESQLMFGDELSRTAGERFRGAGQTINHQLLSYNFVIERHREALLWSYLVARLDKDGDGVYSDDELQEAWSDSKFPTNTSGSMMDVPLPVRDTLLPDHIKMNLEASRFPTPRETEYVFSSQDGYALAELNVSRKLDDAWPDFSEATEQPPISQAETIATIKWSTCWNSEIGNDAVELFKHMAFVKPECGDFLITRLVALSGRKGLSAFLPNANATFPGDSARVKSSGTIPHLPLNDRWQDGKFDLGVVASNTGWCGQPRRIFSMQLIQRYAYTVGRAHSQFEMLTTPKSAGEVFERLKPEGDGAPRPFIGINDDMEEPDVGTTQVMFKNWMEDTWPTEKFKLPFERI